MSLEFPIVPEHPDQAGLYSALGKGLAQWQYIETGLYLIAFHLMDTDHESCSLAFFQIKNAENKLTFIDRLVYHKIPQWTRLNVWKPISAEISNAIDFRNALAHFEIFFLTDDEFKKIQPPTKFRCVLSPHHLDHHAKRGGVVKALAIEVIEHNADELRLIAYRLVYFVLDHAPQTEKLATSLPPRLRQWLNSFRNAARPPGFERPQPPSHPRAGGG